MNLATTRQARVLLQFRRRTLWLSGLVAVAGLVIAGFVDPTKHRGGAILLGVSSSVLASLIVAAVALERTETADDFARLGISSVFHDRLQDLPGGLWTDLLRGVRSHFKVLGMANHGYMNDEATRGETEAALTTALRRKDVTVQFLWLDPTSEIAEVREKEEGDRKLRRDTCDAIQFFWDLRERLVDGAQKRLSLREYSSLPTCGMTWADHNLIVTHYLAGELNLRAPGVVLDTADPMLSRRTIRAVLGRGSVVPAVADAYVKNYTEVASDAWSRPITAERLTELKAFRDSLGEQEGKHSEAELRGAHGDEGTTS